MLLSYFMRILIVIMSLMAEQVNKTTPRNGKKLPKQGLVLVGYQVQVRGAQKKLQLKQLVTKVNSLVPS